MAAPFGYNDEVKARLYGGWNNTDAIQQDWNQYGADKYVGYLTDGGTPFGEANSNRLALDQKAQGIVGQRAVEKQKAETEALNAKQKAAQDEFLGRFRSTVEGQEKLPDMAARIGGQLGLPGLQQTAQGLIKTVAELPKTQTDATRGYNVNSNQLSRIIGAKQAELAPAAQQAVTQQQAAESNLATQLGYGVAQQQKDLLPFTTEQSLLSDQLAREYSGFTTDKQNQLQLMMQNISNGQALTMAQLQNANDLAMAKLQYDNQVDYFNKQQSAQAKQQNFVNVNGGLYNTTTGQWAVKPPLSAFG